MIDQRQAFVFKFVQRRTGAVAEQMHFGLVVILNQRLREFQGFGEVRGRIGWLRGFDGAT